MHFPPIYLEHVTFISLIFFIFLFSPSLCDPRTSVANISCKPRTNVSITSDLFPKYMEIMGTLSDFISENKSATYSLSSNSPDIYGLAKCHNDLSQDECKLCFVEAKDKLNTCIPAPGGSVYLDGCFLRYENYDFFDESVQKNSSSYVCGVPTDITNDQYMKRDFAARVDRAIANVTSMSVVNKGFGATIVKSGLLAVYALGQCWDSLDVEICTKCLNNAGDMIRKCLPAAEGKAMNAGCYLRYSSNKFFGDGALVLADKGPTKRKNIWIIAAIVLLTILGIFAILGAFLGYRRYSTEQGGTKRVHKIPRALETSKLNFKYEMLEKATGGFDPLNKLGQGGSGSVYKGILPDGKTVAVKRLLYNTRQWAEEFFNEVNLISGIQHKNVVKLLGCSIEGPESLLVFDFVSNKNLDQVLFDKNKRQFVSWNERFQIILGIAEGLAYLHEGSKAKIIHRDIKNSNILVDEQLIPKIADFGLARRFAPHKTHVSTGVAGTLGYLAPEYLLQGCLTEKADVYSFGVVAIEVACCIKNNVFVSDSRSVLQTVWRNYKLNKITESIDSRLMSDFQEQEASRVLQLGLLCTQTRRFSRPSMSQVVKILRNKETEVPVPMQPPFQNSSLLAPPDTTSMSSVTKDSLCSEWYSTDGMSIHSSEFASLSSSQSSDFSTSESSRLLKIA
ncbi:cysteine-rich receptor-like protein kinase 42 [Nicotiana tomentosiformis]|uniref:cysteine-rich receptor-like protein kinase 42 n=1 Tax=Nicotiana tomentosiformis TaxID=4098 RepID=UPI00051BFCB8|nr:cysteine-rich receptor-like protein kinase 42 [Nicotiana tomentosiformis]